MMKEELLKLVPWILFGSILVIAAIIAITKKTAEEGTTTPPPPRPPEGDGAGAHPTPPVVVVANDEEEDHDDHHHTPAPARDGHVNGWLVMFFTLGILWIVVMYILGNKAVEAKIKEKKVEEKKETSSGYSGYRKDTIYEGPLTEARPFDNLSREGHIRSIGDVDVSYIDDDGNWVKIRYEGAKTFAENKPVAAPARRPSSTLIVEPVGDTVRIQVIDVKY